MKPEFKQTVLNRLAEQRTRFSGSDAAFAKQFDIHKSVYSRLKEGETEGVLSDAKWMSIARKLNINPEQTVWNTAKTEVFNAISEDITLCKETGSSLICVDECGIGKTYTARYMAATLENTFYLDCSQAKTKNLFIRSLAQTIGADPVGKIAEVLANIKYMLQWLPKPLLILDEVGDLDYNAFLIIKELWNATEGHCGFYMIGADGLRAKIERAIRNRKVGYAEIFNRFNNRFMKIVPAERQEKLAFYKQLITDVISVNVADKTIIPEVVRKCIASDTNSEMSAIRRAKTLLGFMGGSR